ncbi:para-aminobenzoate synthetase component 1 [Mesocricetibacter intestinalis]|uniref:Para-aminobenzoate synthetase component 1 n=1 Tax=Mesocricetibacter intestinalis TaxID=1521930 RepID=A0A4R6V6N2_9PAST|nr:aminodeoxychorismate synthase component I [Mesocricetibacter intestinalis]TDQ56511.1 para-aminobenzoate synthetase component 1 [Mesocricetibacter intestinalis]
MDAFAQFIRQANEYGKQKLPFFFLVDFECRNPLIVPLGEAAQRGIYFDIRGRTNVERDGKVSMPPFWLRTEPMAAEDYRRGFEIVRRELQKGNSYLLNLTYPTPIYTNYTLKQIFQSAEAAYKLLLEDQFVCFSPESFIKIAQNKIYTYPMKGTIDAATENAQQLLLGSEKERREHYTIVDLMRNDLASVATGIKVERFRYPEEVRTGRGAILQTSSEISGSLAADWRQHIGTILSRLLPAGSVSGAPKERTLSIIRQAEAQARGYYSGVFGIFEGDRLQSAVAIRFIRRHKDRLFFHSGGGITLQSRAEEEYQELLRKVYVPLRGKD